MKTLTIKRCADCPFRWMSPASIRQAWCEHPTVNPMRIDATVRTFPRKCPLEDK